MKKITFQPTSLQILYLIIFVLLFAFIIYTPSLITGPVHFTKKLIIEEETIEGATFNHPQVSNKMIIERQPVLPFTSVLSNPQNLNILVACIIPIDKIHDEQRIIIQAIINEITKMFVILNSSYYKKGREMFFENKLKTNTFNQIS